MWMERELKDSAKNLFVQIVRESCQKCVAPKDTHTPPTNSFWFEPPRLSESVCLTKAMKHKENSGKWRKEASVPIIPKFFKLSSFYELLCVDQEFSLEVIETRV